MSEFQAEKSIKICYVVTISITVRSFFIPQLKYLAENGFDVTVVCSPDDKLQQELGNEIRFEPILIPRGLSFMGMIKSTFRLLEFFKKEKFDIIQYSTPNAAFCASIAGKAAKCKVRNYHLMGLRYLGASGVGRFLLKQIEKITCSFSTSVECVSASNLQMGISNKLFQKEKGTVVWNGSTGGVDLTRFNYALREKWRDEVRAELQIGNDDFLFGFAGRITKDKGINEILSAFEDIENAKLLLIGSNEGINTLDQELLLKAKQNKNIIFHEFVTDIERYFAAMDVLLLPSYREGFGNIVIEAAAVGTPAIVSNIPGPIDAIKENITAFTVIPKNAESLHIKMLEIMNTDYATMGKNSVEFVSRCFDSKMLNEKITERKTALLS